MYESFLEEFGETAIKSNKNMIIASEYKHKIH